MKNKEIIKNFFVIFISIFIVYLIVLYPLQNVRLSIGDDVDDYIELKTFAQQNSIGWNLLAVPQGRFFSIFTVHLFALPFVVDSVLWYNLFYILPFVLVFILFTIFVEKLFKNRTFTIISALFVASLMQIIGYGSLTTCYPFIYHIGLSLVFLSLIFLLLFYDKKNSKYLWLSAIILFLSFLIYENFLEFNLVVLTIIAYKNRFTFKKEFNWRKLLKELLPFIIITIIYLSIYFSFRVFYPRPKAYYAGTTFYSDINIFHALKSSFLMSSSALPLYSFNKYLFNSLTLSSYGYYNLFNQDVSFYVIFIIVSSLTFYCLSVYKKIENKKLIITMSLSFLLFFLLPLMLCITPTYYDNQAPHVPTFFAYFAVLMFFISLILLFMNVLQKNKMARYVFITLISLIVGCVSYCVQVSNKYVAQDIKLGEYRFDCVKECFLDDVLKTGYNTPICFQQLNSTTSFQSQWATLQRLQWKNFIFRATNKRVNGIDSYDSLYYLTKNKNINVWVAFFSQTTKTDEALLYFTYLNSNDLPKSQIDIISDSIICLYYSPYKNYNITLATKNYDDTVYVNGMMMNSYGSYHTKNLIFQTQKGKKITHFIIKGKHILANTIRITNIVADETSVLQSFVNRQTDNNLKNKLNLMLNDKIWLDCLMKKATKNNISLEQQMLNDANYMINKEHNKK